MEKLAKNSKIEILGLAFFAICGLSTGCSKPSEEVPVKKFEATTTTSVYYSQVKVRGKDPVCVEISTKRTSLEHSSEFENILEFITAPSSNSCEKDSLQVHLPPLKKNGGSDVYPFTLEIPEDWMTNEIGFGSCSVQISLGRSDVKFNFDICQNQVLKSSLNVRQADEVRFDASSDISVTPVILTDIDRKNKKLSTIAISLFFYELQKVDPQLQENEDSDDQAKSHKKAWDLAVEKAKQAL
ncbi:MAG: hypothetical protein HUU57_04960 [Bdellovibrio sp.]|nr:hypothetical protein [Bdellovibrio sp.]